MKKGKNWKIKFSKEAEDQYKSLPDDVVLEIEKLIKGFKTGKIDPRKIGKPIEWEELDKKLKCPNCKSDDVEWLFDKNSKEVTFHCLVCSDAFWMTYTEYKKAIKRNPDKIIKNS